MKDSDGPDRSACKHRFSRPQDTQALPQATRSPNLLSRNMHIYVSTYSSGQMMPGTFPQPASEKLRTAITRSNAVTLGDVTHADLRGIVSRNLLSNLDLRPTSERISTGPDLSTLDRVAEDVASISIRAPQGPTPDASKAGGCFSVSLNPAITEDLSTAGCWTTIYMDRGCYNLTTARSSDNGICALTQLAGPDGPMAGWLLQLSPSLRGLSQETAGRMPNPRNQAGDLAGAVRAAAATESNTAVTYDEDVAVRVGLCGPATPTTAVCPRSSAPAEGAAEDAVCYGRLEWPQMSLSPTCLSMPPPRCSECSSPCSHDVDETVDLASLASDEPYHVATHCCRTGILSLACLKKASSASKGWTVRESLRQLVAAPLSDPIHHLPRGIREVVEPVPWRGAINSPRADNQPLVIAGDVCSDRGPRAKQPDPFLHPEHFKGLRTGVLAVSINPKSESVAGWEDFLENSSALKGSQAESAGRWDMDCSTTATQHSGVKSGIYTETPFRASTVELSGVGDAYGAVWAGEGADYVSSRSNGYGSDVDLDGWSVDKDPTNWVPLRHRYCILSVNVNDGKARMEVADGRMSRRVCEDADPVPDDSARDYRSELYLDAAIVESDPLKWTPLRVRYAVTPQNKSSVALLHNPGGRVRLLALAFERRIAELQSSYLPRHQAFVKPTRDHGCVSPGGTGSAGLCRVFSPVRLSR
ncbi:hypothetical protein VaNZ11_000395 [Volvox africanus]|uniref:Uncharacterized protein n=1 Tax=Volvox africanus TaxID=51714 RepID=A0ABQ5RMV3_9CHLO|nr:hypothetical protein VaNZ11_000395 [Volvox africanus]